MHSAPLPRWSKVHPVKAINICGIYICDVFGKKSKLFVEFLRTLLNTFQKPDSSLGHGKGRLPFGMRVLFIEAGIGEHPSDLVKQHSIRAKTRRKLCFFLHQFLPFRTGRTGYRKNFVGMMHLKKAFMRLAVFLQIWRIPPASGFILPAAVFIVVRSRIHQMPLLIKRDMSAGFLNGFDVFLQTFSPAQSLTHFKIRILIVMSAVIPSKKPQSVTAMGNGKLIKFRQFPVMPHFAAILLFVDHQKVSHHVLDPTGFLMSRTPCLCPGPVFLCTMMPGSGIQLYQGKRSIPYLSFFYEWHLFHGKGDGSPVFPAALNKQLRCIELRVMPGKI